VCASASAPSVRDGCVFVFAATASAAATATAAHVRDGCVSVFATTAASAATAHVRDGCVSVFAAATPTAPSTAAVLFRRRGLHARLLEAAGPL
jgi:hypothetical protein